MAEPEPTADTAASQSTRLGDLGDLLLALLPGALVVFFGLRNGGFFPGTAALAAAELALCLIVVLVVARRPWDGVSWPLLAAVAAIGGLATWTLASSGWSGSPVRAELEYTRVLLYVLTLVLFGLLPFSVRRIRWMLYGMAIGATAVCTVALIARTYPDVIFYPGLASEDRLGYPLNYWNALAALAGVGILFTGHLACSVREPWFVRMLGAAAIPLLTATLYYTFSRGGTWAALGAVVVYVLLGRPRGLVSGAVATVPPVVVMLMALNPTNPLTDPTWATPDAVAAGHDAARVIAFSVGAAGLLRVLMLPFDRWVAGLQVSTRMRRPVVAVAVGAAFAVAVSGCAVALHVPNVVSDKYAEFTADKDDLGSYAGSNRLLSANSNGREDQWDVAKAAFRRDQWRGSGAGTYAIEWARYRPDTVSVQDAHSFYLELLGELGWPGLLLAAACLLLILGAFAFRARGPDRALFAVLLAGGLAWAAQASVDWLWEMPAVTLWLFAFGGAALARGVRSTAPLPAWTIALRVAGVALCVAVMVLPARVAVSQARIDTGLDALADGDCARAREEARRALSAVPSRTLPYKLIAYCDLQQRRPVHAVRALSDAAKRDPNSWELRYGLAVAKARAGMDPRPAARAAATLNPGEERTYAAIRAFRGTNKKRWRRAGAALFLTEPGPPTP